MVAGTMTGTGQTRVLIVGEEENLLASLRHNLTREGHQVATTARGDDGLRLARDTTPDVVLLDLMLPGLNGIQVCRLLRRDSSSAIIVLTPLRGTDDQIAAFDAGADDCLTKPFGMAELLARVRALIRRSRMRATQSDEHSLVLSGDLTIDVDRREVRRAGVVLGLKPTEFDLLRFFTQHPARALSRSEILKAVWGPEIVAGTRAIDVYVCWLRKKIEEDPSHPVRLRTVRSFGYIFE